MTGQTCPNCNTDNTETAVYCRVCGQILKSYGSAKTAAAATAVSATGAEALDADEAASAEKGRWWRRAIARFIDSFAVELAYQAVLTIIPVGREVGVYAGAPPHFLTLDGLAWMLGPARSLDYLRFWADTWPSQLLHVAIIAVYMIYFIGKLHQTPGKMVMGLAVVSADGSVMTYRRAGIRWLAFDFVPLLFPLIPYLWPACYLLLYFWLAWDPRKQGLHDKVAGTYVIRV